MQDKKRVLFVDDEVNILEGLKRMLRPFRDQWNMIFVNSGAEALEKLKMDPFDVIVTDMRMPQMNGAQLLTEVKNNYPHTIRIALSGYSEHDIVMKSIGLSHQYLTKPCDPETLKKAVARTCSLHSQLKNKSIKKLVSQLDSLPSLPSLYLEIMEELKSPEASIGKVGEIVAKDMGMTAKILQLVNSAFFGISGHISDPVRAVLLLGLEHIRALVLSVKIFDQFKKNSGKGIPLDELWQHSFLTGLSAKKIAKQEKNELKFVEACFTAGLLHNIGMLVFNLNFPSQYKKMLSLVSENQPISELEIEAFGAHHGQVGGYLLGIWGLPDPIIEGITFHHSPCDCINQDFSILTAVHAADALSLELNKESYSSFCTPFDNEYITKIGMNNRIDAWRKICHEEFSKENNKP